MTTNPLLKPTSEDILGQSMMPSGASSGATTTRIITPPAPVIPDTFAANTQAGGGSWTSPQIAQASPAPVRTAPTISQAYSAPQASPAPSGAPAPVAPKPAYDFSQDALTPQANVGGSVEAMLGQVQPAQKPFVNTYWDPVKGKYVEGNMETDRPWEQYGLGSANALYNMDPNTIRALQQRKTIGEQYGTQMINEDEIRQRTMDRFQAEIDAMNRYYAEKTQQELGVAQEAGRGRVGTRTAISARRGMLGGDFGDAAREEVVRYNNQVENNIYNLNQKERLFQELQMRGASTKAAEEAIDKARARLDESIAKAEELRQKALKEVEQRVSNRLAAFLADGREMTEQDYADIAAEMGVDIDQVKAMALQFRPEAEKPLIVDGVAYARQADGTYKAVTPQAKGEASVPTTREFTDGTTRQWVPDATKPNGGSWEVLAEKPIEEPSRTGDLTQEARLRKEFNDQPAVKNFNSLKKDYTNSQAIFQEAQRLGMNAETRSAVDQALIYTFNRMLDPNSAVREGEYARTVEGQALLNRVGGFLSRLQQGGAGITDADRKAMVDASRILYNQAEKTYQGVAQFYSGIASEYGLNPNRIVMPTGDAIPASPTRSTLSPASGSPVSISQIENIAGMTLSPTLRAEVQSAIQEFPNLTADQIAQAFGFNSVGGDTNQATKTSVGSLSQRFESSGDPGAIGRDSTGGWSYGAYQLAHSNAKRFVDASPYARDFQGIAFNSPQFRQKWKEVARRDPQGFKQAQQSFIEQTHIAPQMQKLASAGINPARYSPVFQEVLFSTAVQHGPNNDVIEKAIKRVGANASEDALIKAIYEERWAGGKRFASSTPQVRKAVYNRFFGKDGELNSALKQLA